MMQYIVDAVRGLLARVQIAYVSTKESKPLPWFGPDCCPDLLQILLASGNQIIKPDDLLI